jgi:hypothetical protein
MCPTNCRTWVLVLAIAAMAGCGDETPERAIYALAHDLEHGAYRGACGRLFPSARLPGEAQRALNVSAEERPSWDQEDEANCRRALVSGALADYELVEPRVRSVRTRPLDGSGNVSAIATARVALDGESPTTIRLALVKDRWRVVPDPPRAPR